MFILIRIFVYITVDLEQIDDFGEYEFTSTILQMFKERLDKETIIINESGFSISITFYALPVI